MPKPKECPFCGSKNLSDMSEVSGCGISCLTVGCAAEHANLPLEKWNTRATQTQGVEEVIEDKIYDIIQNKGKYSISRHDPVIDMLADYVRQKLSAVGKVEDIEWPEERKILRDSSYYDIQKAHNYNKGIAACKEAVKKAHIKKDR